MNTQHTTSSDLLHDSPFLRACRREKPCHTPIWLMRQAGRFLADYRKIREKHDFLSMCKTPELATEVTLMPVEQLGVDAAILFADILLITEPLGMNLTFNEGVGPRLDPPIRTVEDINRLRRVTAHELHYVSDAVRMVRGALPENIPLIGFCGAPFTVASYMIEGKGSKNFVATKTLMYRHPEAWHELMDKIVQASAHYLNGQIDSGVQAVQIFDSWVGCLDEEDYRKYVLQHTDRLMHALKPGIPIIHFAANNATLLQPLRDAGGDVIGLDWRVRLDQAWATLGFDIAVQGNLDPVSLYGDRAEVQRRAEAILRQANGRPGHIFNLGHGVLPDTPVDNVKHLIDVVHQYCA